MADDADAPTGTMDLVFAPKENLSHVDDPIHRDVSAIAVRGRTLFAACDETASVERLVYDPETGAFGDHKSFPLGDIFDLPDGRGGEVDIEGLEVRDGWLWACGSHSLKRDDPGADGLSGLDDIDWDENRCFLGRLPLIDRGEGVFEPVATFEALGAETRRARSLKMDDDGGPLRRWLKKDPLIGPFVDIPCKENGLDIEGLAADGDTAWLGLRGPVVGAYALIVELELKEKRGDPRRLKPRKRDGARYRVYALDLAGQAIRDLLFHEGAMYVLSGATTDLEAMQSVHRIAEWPPQAGVVPPGRIERVIDLPVIRHSDHAEGLALFEEDGKRKLLVAFDSPHENRVADETQSIAVDVYGFPGDAKTPNRAATRPAKRTRRGSKRAASTSKPKGAKAKSAKA